MGVNGLLQLLKDSKISQACKISEFGNKTVAIDAYGWLHKGVIAVADKLATGQYADGHINYCMKYVNLLLSHKIKPILVFDGQHLPAKAGTEAKRREKREAAKKLAEKYLRQGNDREARKHQKDSIDITHEMALQLIKRCRDINVDCIVAPYEADAQLAYLNKIGLADYVLTEDSDLILFGCRKTLFKLNFDGNCDLVESDKLHLALDCAKAAFSMEKFRLMCILSGCDYIDSLPGIGLKNARQCVMSNREADVMRAVDKIRIYMNKPTLKIPKEYKTNVMKARATFLHMAVYDPRKRKQVRLNDIEELGTDIEHCSGAGQILDDETALDLAVGNLNPISFERLDKWHPNQARSPSLWFLESTAVATTVEVTAAAPAASAAASNVDEDIDMMNFELAENEVNDADSDDDGRYDDHPHKYKPYGDFDDVLDYK